VAALQDWRLGAAAMVSLFTGMRLSEVLALRWHRVDLDAGIAKVREALEQTKAHGIRFKAPKSKAGRRDIALSDVLVNVLRKPGKPRSNCACSLASEATRRCAAICEHRRHAVVTRCRLGGMG
jgi:integrase